jgi:hypothetical protein
VPVFWQVASICSADGNEFRPRIWWSASVVSAITNPAKTEALPPLFASLEERLGYRFQRQSILREALTHPSSAASLEGQWSPSYQRLEFLGDGIYSV